MKTKKSLKINLKKSISSILLLLIFASGIFAAEKKTGAKKNESSEVPKNVVALSKSVAEMWLLSGGILAGTTDDGLELESAKNAVSVGTLTTSSLEAIVSLNPDFVILTFDIPLHKKLYENLRTFGIKTYVADVKKFDDYEKVMKDFSDLTGRKDLFKKNVLDVKLRIADVLSDFSSSQQLPQSTQFSHFAQPVEFEKSEKFEQSEQSKSESKKSSYLLLRMSSAKNKVLKNNFVNEVIEDFGLVPIVNDSSLFDEIGIEAIVSADPDYIFVVQQGNQKNAEEAFYRAYEKNPAWKNLSAVKNGNVFVLPKDLFNYKPNARWVDSYEYVLSLIEGKK